MFEKYKVYKIKRKIDQLIENELFKNRLNLVINEIMFACKKINIKSRKNYIIYNCIENGKEYNLKIIMTNDSLEYTYYTNNNLTNEWGKYTKLKNKYMTQYSTYTKEILDNININTNTTEVFIFNNTDIQTYSKIETKQEKYIIDGGLKIPYDEDNNYKTTTIITRTNNNNLLRLDKTTTNDKEIKKYYILHNLLSKYISTIGNYIQIKSTDFYDCKNKKSSEKNIIKSYLN